MGKILALIFSFFSIFSPVTEEPKLTTLILGGDVMLGRTVMTTALDKNDPIYPFRKISDYLGSADITFVNLENAVTKDCKPDATRSSMVFCAKPEMLEGPVYSGVDIVNLANNHTLNYGKAGFIETKQFLENKNIDFTGDSNLIIKDVNGTKFGFLGFEKSQQANPKLCAAEINLISQSDAKVDVLVVAMHWGVEYQDTALPGVTTQAHEIVNLGADVVVGHHPHWVQNTEYYNGVPIYYSLGNLVFDQMWSEKTKEGLLVKLTFENRKIVKEELVTTYMGVWGQPKIIHQ